MRRNVRDIIEIVRTEMLYFVPQMQTKIMNEGWACLTRNSLVLTKHGLLRYDVLHQLLTKGIQHTLHMSNKCWNSSLTLLVSVFASKSASSSALKQNVGNCF